QPPWQDGVVRAKGMRAFMANRVERRQPVRAAFAGARGPHVDGVACVANFGCRGDDLQPCEIDKVAKGDGRRLGPRVGTEKSGAVTWHPLLLEGNQCEKMYVNSSHR